MGPEEDVFAELARVEGSEAFQGSARLRRFLRYLVTETLAGRGSEIKEYSVALAVFDKPDSFDPKTDSTVRSEASKLRMRLRLYYETAGRDNPLQLSIPKGAYAVEWQARTEDPPAERAAVAAAGGKGRAIGITLMVLAVAGIVTFFVQWARAGVQPTGGKFVLRRLTTDSLSTDPAISGEGKLVVYASDRAGRGDLDLWVQPVSSKDAMRLTDDPADESEPAISPDGSQIAFRSERDGGGIYIIPVLGGQPPRLLAKYGRRPCFSPDGLHVAYSVSNIRFFLNVPGSGTAYEIGIDGGTPREIAPGYLSSHFPVYSPDGKHLLFIGNKGGVHDWWVIPARGGEPVQTGLGKLVAEAGFRGADSHLPVIFDNWNGDSLYFAARKGDETNLWRLAFHAGEKASGKAERLTLGASTETLPGMSEAGKVVFTTAIPNGEILGIPLDAEKGVSSGPVLALAPSPVEDGWPSVTRDGRQVAFLSTRGMRNAIYLLDRKKNLLTSLISVPGLRSWSELSPEGESITYHTQAERGYDAWEQRIGEGAPARVCTFCAYMGRTRDRRTVLYSTLQEPARTMRRDGTTGVESAYLKAGKGSVYQALLSPDERWVAFYVRLSPDRTRISIAPWDERANVPEQEWMAVTDGESHDTTPVWSPEGRVLYFASDRDGFTCIYGQRIRQGGRGVDGPPFPVRHLHAAAERAGNLGVSFRGFGVGKDLLVLKADRMAGNVWILE